MDEWSPYDLSDFEYEVLCLYIKYGYGFMKVYDTTFFTGNTDESIVLTLDEYKKKVDEYKEGTERCHQ